jgi:hypothetical protein
MKTYRRTEEVIDHGEKIVIQDVDIDGVLYDLAICNFRQGLGISFYLADARSWGEHDSAPYSICIIDGSVRIGRHCSRPGHDHDDNQDLLILKEKKDAVFFGTGGFSPNDTSTLLKIPFGGITR